MSMPEGLAARVRPYPAQGGGRRCPRCAPSCAVALFLLQSPAPVGAGEDDWPGWADPPAGAARAVKVEPRPHLPLDPADGAPLPMLGEGLDAAESAALPATVYPDGRGLPAGVGNVAEGAALFAGLCAQCHGPDGRGGSAPELAGGHAALDSDYPDQNIGTWWPFATTLFDFLRRSMPMYAPGSLSDDQYYSLTAFLLEGNGLWPAGRPLDAAALTAVKMPNRDGFDSYWPDRGVHP